MPMLAQQPDSVSTGNSLAARAVACNSTGLYQLGRFFHRARKREIEACDLA